MCATYACDFYLTSPIKRCYNIIDGVYFVQCSIFLLLNLIYLKSKMLLNILFLLFLSKDYYFLVNLVFVLMSGICTKNASRYSLKSGYLVCWRNLFSEAGTPRLVKVCNSYLQVPHKHVYRTTVDRPRSVGVDMPSGQRRKQPHCQLSGAV